MNKQFEIIDGQKVNHKIEWTDYTINEMGGCEHGCGWTLPGGEKTICYAEAQVDRMQSDKFFPEGFKHHYWHPERLKEMKKVKEPSRIFHQSMGDTFGRWVPDEQILATFDACREADWHTHQFLTKNAPRLLKFNGKFPPNAWIGASVPPSIMRGHELILDQQRQMLRKTLDVLAQITAPVKWISFEPLTFDVSPCLAWAYEQYGNVLQWAVIGAASNGPTIYQPKPIYVRLAIEQLRQMDCRIFFKGNLRGNAAADPWLEEFPVIKKAEVRTYEQHHLI